MGFAALAIIVQLSNIANVPTPIVREAQSEVARVFAAAGVPIEFTAEDTVGTAPRSADDVIVRVLLLDHESGALRACADSVLGAANTTEWGTRIAWVFYRRVEEAGDQRGVRAALVLACTIAHEIGHLLGREHSAVGLMRARWNQHDFGRAARSDLRFSPEEAADLRDHLSR